MIKRRAERRSEFGMHFLLYPGGNQVEIRVGASSFTRGTGQGQAFSYYLHDGPRE